MSRVIWFEFAAEQSDRAIRFYEGVFGWQIKKWECPQPYWLITTRADDHPGIHGGMLPRGDGCPNAVNTIDVESVDKAVESILAAGGSVAVPKMAIEGMGWIAYCRDTEGNLSGVMQAMTM